MAKHWMGQAMRWMALIGCAAALAVVLPLPVAAEEIEVQASRSTLIKSPHPMGEVIVADPTIADVHAHGSSYLSVLGKRPGTTTVRIFDKDRKLLQTYDVHVGYDLVAIRQALKNFLPDELIGVEMVNTNIALTGQVSNATAADRAVRIVSEFVQGKAGSNSGKTAGGGAAAENLGILNLLQVTSGQQVMLRVRVGEIQREALKELGVDLSAFNIAGSGSLIFGTGAGLPGFFPPLDGSDNRVPGSFIISDPLTDANGSRGILLGQYTRNNRSVGGMLRALEHDGLFKLLAEPNLVAISGEEAEFLAGGEIPIPVPQGGSGSTTISIEYKPFGVAVRFRPFVLNENRIRMEVQPEVSELDSANGVTISGFTVPALSTRRAKTTVELAPGESFMIAGLIKDQVRSSIEQLPGVKELPVLGALFRSTNFQRNESELVIAVTPYIVDPMKSSDVRLPTDNFAPASQMEMLFYGTLGALSGGTLQLSQTPSAEGPIGFMVE